MSTTVCSRETKEKIRKALLGHKVSDETREKLRQKNLGQKHSEYTKKKLSNYFKGKKKIPFTEEHKKNISKSKMGVFKGDKHWNWKGGLTSINEKIRKSTEYKLWRNAVYERDNYTCVWCGQVGGDLEADHIKPFALFPELRFAIDNGRTLCVRCHKTTETWGRKTKICLKR